MNKKRNSFIILFFIVCILSGCRRDSGEPAYESVFSEAASSSEIGEETTEEPTSGDSGEEPESTGESAPIEYVKWDGTGTLKKNGAEYLGKMQYFNGKTYVIDTDDTVLGEPLPVVARQTENGPVEPVVSYFYFTEDTLFYLEESEVTKNLLAAKRCFDLYAQSLGNEDVRLLAREVGEAVYQDGVITYEVYKEPTLSEEKPDVIIKQVDAETGKLLNEFNFGNQCFVFDYNKENVLYYSNEESKYYYYNFKEKISQSADMPEVHFLLYSSNGNIYARIPSENGLVRVVELYEQGTPVYRSFPREFSGDIYFSHEKVFYEEDRKVMEYDLEKNETRCVCELGSDEYGENTLHSVEESGGVILLREDSSGPEGGYGIIYLYEVRDGEKTLITDGFWTS